MIKDKTLLEKFRKATDNNQQLAAYRPFAPETLKSLRNYYRIGLTYSSNALEGNSLTESETKVVIEEGLTIDGKPLRDIYEAVGHAKAYDYLQQIVQNEQLTENAILMLHRLFYQQIDTTNAGQYRKVMVFISGSQYAVTSVQHIKTEMSELVKWYNKNEKELHPIELAAQFHRRFIFIHPFIDGNGRVARLLMNFALLRNGYSIAIIPTILRTEYISTLELAHHNELLFCNFIADRVIATQLDLLRLLREYGGINNGNGGINNGNGGIKNRSDGGIKEKILQLIILNPGINAPNMSAQIGKSLRTIQRYLQQLTSEQKIEFRGALKNGGYYIKSNE